MTDGDEGAKQVETMKERYRLYSPVSKRKQERKENGSSDQSVLHLVKTFEPQLEELQIPKAISHFSKCLDFVIGALQGSCGNTLEIM